MRKAIGWLVLSAMVLAAGLVTAAEPAKPAAPQWPLWDGKESVADYAKRAGIKDVQTELDLGGGVSMKLTLIPAGKYLMGLNMEQVVVIEGVRVMVKEADKDAGLGLCSPQREVTFSRPFHMGVYEVTQEQYERVMGTNPSTFKGKNNPVDSISWPQAVLFCKKLSAMSGMDISLPSEAQWEYAYRAGTTTRFYWGDSFADTYKFENYGDKSLTIEGTESAPFPEKIKKNVDQRDRDHDDGFDKSAPVGSFKPNPWGLYDMQGNVSEWIHDCFTGNLFGAPAVDPKGPGYMQGFGDEKSQHWSKGCDWLHDPQRYPYFGRPQYGYVFGSFFTGFRIVAGMKSDAGPAQEAKAKAPAAPATALAGSGDSKVHVPPGCRAAAGTRAEPYTKSGWAQAIVHEATGIELVYIPAGSFRMGVLPDEDLVGTDEAARYINPNHRMTHHQVMLTKGFYMGKTEVTQAQWEKVMGKNPAYFAGRIPAEEALMRHHMLVTQHDAGPNAPVEMVSWDDCQAFCQKAGGGLRLPTEAEWEYACRAGTQGLRAGDLDEMGWCLSNSDGTTHPVGSKKPNAWGLYDMHGNVWEFCQDWFGPYEGLGDAVTDPTGPTKAGGFPPARVIRGGGWGDYGSHCISAIRGGFSTAQSRGHPVPAFPAVGCRFVITAAGTP